MASLQCLSHSFPSCLMLYFSSPMCLVQRWQAILQLCHAVVCLQPLPSVPAQHVSCPRALCRTADLSLCEGGAAGKGGYQEEQQPQLVLPVLKPKDLFAIQDGWQRLARQFPVCPKDWLSVTCSKHAWQGMLEFVNQIAVCPPSMGLHCPICMATMTACSSLTWCRKGILLVDAAWPMIFLPHLMEKEQLEWRTFCSLQLIWSPMQDSQTWNHNHHFLVRMPMAWMPTWASNLCLPIHILALLQCLVLLQSVQNVTLWPRPGWPDYDITWPVRLVQGWAVS